MGRKLSVAEHELHGNPCKFSKAELERRRKQETQTPRLSIVPSPILAVEPPEDLGAVGTKKFKELLQRRVFDNVEAAELYARLFEQKAEADADIKENGSVIKSERGWKQNPACKLSIELAKELTKLLNCRNKVPATLQNPAANLLSDALAQLAKRGNKE